MTQSTNGAFDRPDQFWGHAHNHLGIISEVSGQVLTTGAKSYMTRCFSPDASINIAQEPSQKTMTLTQ